MMSIEKQFRDVAIDCNGITLFKKADALRFVDECEKEHIILLGIDGFFITDSTTQPSMENSVDFTSIPAFSGELYEVARAFLNSRSDTLHFEIVYDEKDKGPQGGHA